MTHFRVLFISEVNLKKTCREYGSFEDGTPETHTTLIVPVLNGINDLEKAVETNMNQDIAVRCAKCGKDTTHTRVQNFLFLPETLALCFTRFEVNNGTTRKNSVKVQLPIELKNLGNMSSIMNFALRLCIMVLKLKTVIIMP